MDKNTITGFVLIGLLLILFQVINQPSAEEIEKRQQEKALQEQTQQSNQQEAVPTQELPEKAISSEGLKSQFQQNPNSTGQELVLENEKIIATFNTKGGRLTKVQLKDFNTSAGAPVVLMQDSRDKFNYQFVYNNQTFATQEFDFAIQNQTANSITFRLAADDGYFEQVYQLSETEEYSIDYDLNVIGLGSEISNTEIELNWKTYLQQQEEDLENERYRTAAYYQDNDNSVDYLAERSDDEDDLEKMPVKWMSFKQHFFNSTLIAKNDGLKAGNISSKTPVSEQDSSLKVLTAQLFIPFDKSDSFTYPMQIYAGPNHYNTLKAKGIGLENVVYLGWAVFRWVNLWLIIPIFNFLNNFIPSYGIIILLLTVLIKTMLFPLTFRSYKSMAKMGVLKPEIEALKAKFPDDAQKQQQETMKLYSSTGVNPVGGCLPQLLQMPILIAMFYFFPSSIELRQESFLWAHDLSTYDSILNLPFNIPLYGSHVSLFTLLMAVASLAYARMNSSMNAASANPQMQFIQYFMPIFLVFIFNSWAAALTYYYFLSNVITFAQQYTIKKFFIDEDEMRKEMLSKKKVPAKKGKFQAKMEKMLKDQQAKQAQMQEQKKKKK